MNDFNPQRSKKLFECLVECDTIISKLFSGVVPNIEEAKVNRVKIM